MTNVAIIQARMGSQRLPGKVLEKLGTEPVLGWVVRAARAIPGIDTVVIATSDNRSDDAIATWGQAQGVTVARGSENDVLSRFVLAARAANATVVMRLTADCPFLDPTVCGETLYLLGAAGADYVSNVDPATWPDGLDCEAFTAGALYAADAEAMRPADREHVTPFLRHNRDRFRVAGLICPLPGLAKERWTLDTGADLEFLKATAALLPASRAPSYIEVLRALDANPTLRKINTQRTRNDGYQATLAAEAQAVLPNQRRSYEKSTAFLARAEKTIPLGSQTFSKSKAQFPPGAAPLFLTHGDGGRVWDLDGNEYVDLVSGLLSVVLGYRDPDVDAAIRAQLQSGANFSLATRLEAELAERLTALIPAAEKVRFAKNGTDATSAAVRIARAATGRDRILACGYHGWQDWFIGATSRSKGVPPAVRALTEVVPYNDLEAVHAKLRQRPGEIAALIMEPMNLVEPAPGYLSELKELLHGHGALLIFDEIITGFRFALGGAQAYFGTTPDLASFGKAMGNGMPLSAVVGRADLMDEMNEIFFSATFGGEALSLAAAIAVTDKMQRENVIDALWQTGGRLAAAVTKMVAQEGLGDVIRLNGKAPWIVLSFADHKAGSASAVKTMLIAEMASRGVLTVGSHNVNYAHTAADVAHVLGAYRGALAAIRAGLDSGDIRTHMRVPPLEPVFRIR
jgi:glutamate-1-semialdehyde 2,1-aminomutase/spore coat polysaccharide biosynthesis protein SpsF